MRSKESPPLLHVKSAEKDRRDIESAAPDGTNDAAAVPANSDSHMEMKLIEPSPYSTTTAPVAAVKVQRKYSNIYPV